MIFRSTYNKPILLIGNIAFNYIINWLRMGKYFGTDGFRGEAGITLTADHAYKVGRFLGWYYNALRERNGDTDPDHDTCQKYVSEVVDVIRDRGYSL